MGQKLDTRQLHADMLWEKAENSYKANGDLISKHSYKYDDKGNLMEDNFYKSDSSINIKLTYKYEFDKKNNWIQQIQFKNHIPIYIFERKIKYYD